MVIDEQAWKNFLTIHALPDAYRVSAEAHFLPFASKLAQMRNDDAPLLLGINGAQGTGKTTLADFIRRVAENRFGWNVAVLSLDDFYLTRAERDKLARTTHPLLQTRGVPGTHDTAMLQHCIQHLSTKSAGQPVVVPRFDKAIDDRGDRALWPVYRTPVDLIVLEGWCVGSRPQAASELVEPVNELERDEDPDARWREYVNRKLADDYRTVFEMIDALVFLQAPGFDAILRWRLEQEQKLAGGRGVMRADEILRFVQHFERLTRANLEYLPNVADVVFMLDESHAVVAQ